MSFVYPHVLIMASCQAGLIMQYYKEEGRGVLFLLASFKSGGAVRHWIGGPIRDSTSTTPGRSVLIREIRSRPHFCSGQRFGGRSVIWWGCDLANGRLRVRSRCRTDPKCDLDGRLRDLTWVFLLLRQIRPQGDQAALASPRSDIRTEISP